MEKPKIKPTRNFTPNSKVGSSLSKAGPAMKSQKLLIKHKPSSSCGGSASEKKLIQTKASQSRPSQKPSTERAIVEVKKKLIVHRKSSSISDKSSVLIQSTMQAMHRRKPSQDLKKSTDPHIVKKISYRSHTGLMPGNPQKVNQDSVLITKELNFNSFLVGVADGHGINGEHVSRYIKDRYATILSTNPFFLSDPSKAISASASKLNKEIGLKDFDTNFSGSTFITVLIRNKKLWCANIGDSRALLGREVQGKGQGVSNHWMSIALSRDHKPNETDESSRISRHGGRVEAYQDEHGNPFGPSRVWLKHQNIPGLAMSRSLGDKVAASVGVICEPEILEFEVIKEDKFIVLGSDGIFEFLTNEDVVKFVVPYWRRGDAEGAAETLAREARLSWIRVRSI